MCEIQLCPGGDDCQRSVMVAANLEGDESVREMSTPIPSIQTKEADSAELWPESYEYNALCIAHSSRKQFAAKYKLRASADIRALDFKGDYACHSRRMRQTTWLDEEE